MMTPAQRGHRDAAQLGEHAKNPYDAKTQPAEHGAWLDAYHRVNNFRGAGLDPNGHHPRMPRLCERDVTKVCNCCENCGTLCWSEGLIERAQRVIDRIPGASLLRKVFRGRS